MEKKRGIEKSEAIFQIANLVLAILAFSFLVSLSTPVVSGLWALDPEKKEVL